MSVYGDDTQFEDLSHSVFDDLISELNKNSAWKKVETHVMKTYPSLGTAWVKKLEQRADVNVTGRSPADLLLVELRSRLCDVKIFCSILRACELFDALYLLEGREDLVIVEQPNSRANGRLNSEVEIGDVFSLSCKATGLPPPRYEWWCGNARMPDQTSSTLSLLITSPDQEDEYRCKISQYSRDDKLVYDVFSERVILKVKPTPIEIIKQPGSPRVMMGETLILNCEAKGHPTPEYQWYKDNNELHGETSSTFRIEKFERKDQGQYYCRAWNVAGELFTDKADVQVDYHRQKAQAKIALLIANSNYQREPKLPLTINDAARMGTLLKQLGFHIICLQNLTLEEMDKAISLFCTALKPGSYGFFYFAGHGFKMDERYLMPINTPEKYLKKHTISEGDLLSRALEKDPALFVGVLDMCQILPQKELNPEIHNEKYKAVDYPCNDNLLMAYSTCNYHPSHELKNAENGVYVSHLSKQISERSNTEPIHKLIEETAYSVRAAANHRTMDQKPMHTIIPMEPYRYFTDTVIRQSSGQPTEYVSILDRLTKFEPKTVPIKFKKCNVSCEVTIQPQQPPFLNVLLLSISNLENWHVKFENPHNELVELSQTGTECVVYNPQRMTASNQGSMVIKIGRNGTVLDSKRFPYMKHVPEILRKLWKGLDN